MPRHGLRHTHVYAEGHRRLGQRQPQLRWCVSDLALVMALTCHVGLSTLWLLVELAPRFKKIVVRADWEVSLEKFTPVLPAKRSAASPAASPARVHNSSSEGLRSGRLPATLSGAGSDHDDSEAEADLVPTPLSEVPFEGAHIVEFCELTSSNSRIQLENFLENFRGESQLAPLVRYSLRTGAVLMVSLVHEGTLGEDFCAACILAKF